MRHLTKLTALAVFVLGATFASAEEAGSRVGQKVITRSGTALKIGRKVVDDPIGRTSPNGRQRLAVRVYTVEKASGPWLWLVPEEKGPSGWVKADQAVPCEQAIEHYTGEINAHPDNARAYVGRGHFRRAQGDLNGAIADFDRAIELDPKDAAAYYHRGGAWDAILMYDKAIADYTEAIRLDPGSTDPYVVRGVVWGATGNLDRAIADFSAAIRLDPRFAPWFLVRGASWQAKGADDNAIADYTAAIRLDPRLAVAYVNRSGAWASKGEIDNTIADCHEAIRLDQNMASAYAIRGLAWEWKGDFDRAFEDFNRAIQLDPQDATTYYNRGIFSFAKHDFDNAIADLSEAIRLDPSASGAYAHRGVAWIAKDDLDRAVADFNVALRLDPYNAGAFGNRGLAWVRKGEFDKAIADLGTAIRLAEDQKQNASQGDPPGAMAMPGQPGDISGFGRVPTLAEMKRGVAATAKRDDDVQQAAAGLGMTVLPDPNTGMLYRNRGIAWEKQGDFARSLADLDTAIRLDPLDIQAHNGRAWLWATCPDARFRDGASAIRSARTACELTGYKYPPILDTLAAAYAETGDFEQAVKWQEKAVELSKDEKADDPEVYHAHLKLYQAKQPCREDPMAR